MQASTKISKETLGFSPSRLLDFDHFCWGFKHRTSIVVGTVVNWKRDAWFAEASGGPDSEADCSERIS